MSMICLCVPKVCQIPEVTVLNYNKSTLDNSPPPNYDKESKDKCHHVNKKVKLLT